MRGGRVQLSSSPQIPLSRGGSAPVIRCGEKRLAFCAASFVQERAFLQDRIVIGVSENCRPLLSTVVTV